ncbi:MAG: peptidylprolyl isomerase, partial [Candidatus Marinimicrobia bacterium]|nr:peptidylprolyl isomerase [Candidatus Neomarinimicrobiota bacterium]
MKFIRAITLATVISLIFACSLKRESDYVAMINGDKILVEDFLNNYRNFLNVTGIQDNLPSRKMILDNVINEKLILSEFEKNNMNTAVDFIETKNIIYEQLLLNYYCEKEILPKIEFSNKKLFQFYIQENTFYHIKQVFTSDLNKAREYYEQLNTGISFEELARSEDVYAEKVDLGFVKLKDINRRFRQEITGLKVGEISQPTRGRFGYTILRIEEKRTSPILTEYEYAKQRNILSEKLRLEYSDSLQHNYLLKLKKEISFLWIEDNLKFLFDIFKKVKTKDDLPVNMETFISLNNPICQIDGEDYYYKDFLPLILKSRVDQIRAVRDIDLLKDFITGLVIREKLIDKAKSIGIDQTPEFLREYNRKLTKLELDYWVQCFQDTVQFRDSDYNAFYQANQTEFIIPVRRKVYEICIPDEQIAQGLKKRIENGERFQQL